VLHSAKRAFAKCYGKNTQQSDQTWEFWELALPSVLTVTLGKAAVTIAHTVMATFVLPRVDSALGKAFGECPTKNTRQRALCHQNDWRVTYTEGGTRQRLCRVHLGLYRVPVALIKEAESGSAKFVSFSFSLIINHRLVCVCAR
jgi:hypothetical protein